MGTPTNGDIPVNTVDSARRLINDLIQSYNVQYSNGRKNLEPLSEIESKRNQKNFYLKTILQDIPIVCRTFRKGKNLDIICFLIILSNSIVYE